VEKLKLENPDTALDELKNAFSKVDGELFTPPEEAPLKKLISSPTTPQADKVLRNEAWLKNFSDKNAVKKMSTFTKFLIKISYFINHNYSLIIITLLILFFIIKRFSKSKKGVIFIQNFIQKIPLIFYILQKINFIEQSKNICLLLEFYAIDKNFIIEHFKKFKILPNDKIEIICEKNSYRELNHLLTKMITQYNIKTYKKVKKLCFLFELFIMIFLFIIITAIIITIFQPMLEIDNMQTALNPIINNFLI
jgi:hypothetical protein